MNSVRPFISKAKAARAKWDAALERLERASAADIVASAAYTEAKAAYDAARPKPGWSDGVVFMRDDTADAEERKRVDREAMKASGYVAILKTHINSLAELMGAIEVLIDMPAPDLPGAIRKLEISIEHDLSAGGLSPLLDDLRRHALTQHDER